MFEVYCLMLPVSLVFASLWRIRGTLRASAGGAAPGLLWLAAYVMVNALTCVWAATVLGSFDVHYTLPGPLKTASVVPGTPLFIVFSLVLAARPLLHGVRRISQRAMTTLRQQLGRAIRSTKD